MGYIDEIWYVGSDGHKYYTHLVCCHKMRIFNASYTYLFYLTNDKKIKYAIADMLM